MGHLSKKESPEVVEDDIHINIKAGGGERSQAEHEYDLRGSAYRELASIERSPPPLKSGPRNSQANDGKQAPCLFRSQCPLHKFADLGDGLARLGQNRRQQMPNVRHSRPYLQLGLAVRALH